MERLLPHPWLAPSDEVQDGQRAVLMSTPMPNLPRCHTRPPARTMNRTLIQRTSRALQRSEKSQKQRQMAPQQQILCKVEKRRHLRSSLLSLAA